MAVYANQPLNFTKPAGGDLSAAQFTPVKLNTSGQVVACTAATDRVIGVLQNDPKTNQGATICPIGVSKVVTDGSGTAIAVGDLIGTNASGLAVKKATADYATFGVAMGASTAANAVIECFVFGPGFFRTAAG